MNYYEIVIKREKEEALSRIDVFRRKFDLGVVAIGDIDPKQASNIKVPLEATSEDTKLRSGVMLPICNKFANAIIHHFEGKMKKVIF